MNPIYHLEYKARGHMDSNLLTNATKAFIDYSAALVIQAKANFCLIMLDSS